MIWRRSYPSQGGFLLCGHVQHRVRAVCSPVSLRTSPGLGGRAQTRAGPCAPWHPTMTLSLVIPLLWVTPDKRLTIFPCGRPTSEGQWQSHHHIPQTFPRSVTEACAWVCSYHRWGHAWRWFRPHVWPAEAMARPSPERVTAPSCVLTLTPWFFVATSSMFLQQGPLSSLAYSTSIFAKISLTLTDQSSQTNHGKCLPDLVK